MPFRIEDFKESDVPNILARDESLRGVGDLHYSKQSQFIPKIHNPMRRTDKARNKAIEGVRASIEHTVSRLKDWKILKGQYRGDRRDLLLVEKFTRVLCAM
jgi:hypothetical protein